MARLAGGGYSFFIPGAAVVGASQAGVLVPVAGTIQYVKVYSTTAPTVQALIVDIHLNGTTIFTTQTNRPQVAATANAATSGVAEVTALAAGDRLTVDVDQVGTVTGGAPLLVTVVLL